MEVYKHSEITHKIIGCAMEVHSFLGVGFPEVVYQRALEIELRKAGMNFQRELEIPIFYKEHKQPIGARKVDFLVEGLILVELKAIGELTEMEFNQILNYLKAYKLGSRVIDQLRQKSLRFKRFVM
jgi:GxxExxY protein